MSVLLKDRGEHYKSTGIGHTQPDKAGCPC